MKDTQTESLRQVAGTRRRFLKMAGLAAVPLADGIAPSVSAQADGGNLSSFIRLRERMDGHGWKFYKVKSVKSHYPKREDEPDFLPGIYGGDSRVTWEATGRFRLQKESNRWWFVDPEGHPFLSRGVNTINPTWNRAARETVKKMGSEDAWLKQALSQLRSAGFNTAGYWSRVGTGQMAYAYYDFSSADDPVVPGAKLHGLMACFMARIAARSGRRFFPAFHPEFESFCEERTKRLETVKGDPWLLGYFTDNELALPWLESCLRIDPADSGYGACGAEALRWWGAREKEGREKPNQKDSEAWMGHVYDWYLKVATSAIRKQDPNHLILGSRLYSRERNYVPVLKAAGRHVDVVAVNPYGMASVPVGRMLDWSKWAGDKPVLIGEFYVKGLVASVESKMGAGLVVATQSDRGKYYENFTLSLLESSVCVGWHWHQYTDGLRVNTGIVDAQLVPYDEVVTRVGEVNLRAHAIAARA